VQKKQLIERRPIYRHGQLLLEDDFIEEQQFHSHARYRHSHHLHGFGVVEGLEVTRAGDFAVSISPGYAVDRRGHEIELRDGETLEISGLPVGALAWVTIGYRAEHSAKADDSNNRIACYAYLRVATGVETYDVRLATVQLDERGKLAQHAVSHDQRDRLRTAIAPGSVTADALAEHLRRDWITMSFHPSDMPQDEDDARPPFRVGASQALTHREIDGKPNSKGGAGTMTIMLPLGVRHIHRFRIAGEKNEHKLTAVLVKGGFDNKTMKHLREEMLTLEAGKGPYFETGEIPENHRSLLDRHRTLAVDIRAHGYAGVSLIAVEVSY
jgi:hypothetical protein